MKRRSCEFALSLGGNIWCPEGQDPDKPSACPPNIRKRCERAQACATKFNQIMQEPILPELTDTRSIGGTILFDNIDKETQPTEHKKNPIRLPIIISKNQIIN